MWAKFFEGESKPTAEECISYDNALGHSILAKASESGFVKQNLQAVADVMAKKVLGPLLREAFVVDACNQIKKKEFQDAIFVLAQSHTEEGKQFGGLLRDSYQTANEVISDIKKVRHLLLSLKKTLQHIQACETPLQIAQVTKVILDLGFCYVNKLPNLYAKPRQKRAYQRIKNLIWVTPEELNVRIARSEVENTMKFATQPGIRRDDLVSLEEGKNRLIFWAGKAVYSSVDMEERIRLTAKECDKLLSALDYARGLNKPLEITKAEKAFSQFKNRQRTNFGSAWLAFFIEKAQHPAGVVAAIDDMPLDELQKMAKHFEPSSIKLARSMHHPLVASISGSTARPLITLLHLGGFYTKGKMDFDKVQILTNCIAGYIIEGSHHSAAEGAEVQNRVIDAALLLFFNRLKNKLRNKIERIRTAPEQHSVSAVEEMLPYFHPGDYQSFLHPSLRGKVIEEVNHLVESRALSMVCSPR